MTRTVKRNPRVAVTFSPESMRVLDQLSAALGQPKSALISELIDEALPALVAAVEALKVVKEQPREAQRLMTNFAAQASMELAQEQLAFDAALDGRTVKGKRRRKGESDGTS